jgi:hypothetical protein
VAKHILRSDAAFGVSDLVLNVLPALAIETGAEWITTATTRVRQECCPIFTATGKGVALATAGSQNIAPHHTRFIPTRDMFLPVRVFWKGENEISICERL